MQLTENTFIIINNVLTLRDAAYRCHMQHENCFKVMYMQDSVKQST